jgi:tetratricopeptide (TPR) repeat protein
MKWPYLREDSLVNFWQRLFGKSAAKQEPARAPSPRPAAPRVATSDDRIKRLWEEARKLGWTDAEQEKAVGMYSELLTLVDEQSTAYNVCAILRNRAIAHRSCKKYDAALGDLAREMEIAQRRGDRLRVLECGRITEETREKKWRAEIEAGGGDKAAKLRAMEEHGYGLWRSGPDFDAPFNSLLADLEHCDPDVRAEASRLLADAPNALRKIISIYEECLRSNPRRASLAGRVLGRKIAKGSDDMVHAEIARMMYGISASFLPCSCVHCGHLNRGIAAPPSGPMVAYYHQPDDKGAYAVPVLCDKCGKEFFVVWDTDPR